MTFAQRIAVLRAWVRVFGDLTVAEGKCDCGKCGAKLVVEADGETASLAERYDEEAANGKR